MGLGRCSKNGSYADITSDEEIGLPTRRRDGDVGYIPEGDGFTYDDVEDDGKSCDDATSEFNRVQSDYVSANDRLLRSPPTRTPIDDWSPEHGEAN